MIHKIKKTFFSTLCAIEGIRTVFREEQNFKTGTVLALIAILFGAFLHISKVEMIFIILCCFLVFTAEIANTAVEDLCNKIEPHHDPVIGKIKDIMAAYVLMNCILSFIIGCIIFVPKLLIL